MIRKTAAAPDDSVLNESVEADIYEETEFSADGETDSERQPLNDKAKQSSSGIIEYKKSVPNSS